MNPVNRLDNDKYYTPVELSERLIKKTYSVIGKEKITEVIEPSAGNGSFSNQIENVTSYDIDPEAEGIIKQDFLKLDIGYKEGRLIIGNPPFGKHMNMAREFYNKSVDISDYIAFILPISQLSNKNSLYKFDLIHSEDLGLISYSGVELHCCYNIYARPKGGDLNKLKRTKLKDITMIRQDSKKYEETKHHDIRMCYWGDASAGKILKEGEKYAAEYKIIVNNPELINDVKTVLENTNWHDELNKIASLKIQQFHIHDLLKRDVEGIK